MGIPTEKKPFNNKNKNNNRRPTNGNRNGRQKFNRNKQAPFEHQKKREQPQQQQPKKPKTEFEIRIPKIIIRNLSFKLNEELLKSEMEKNYGAVKLVSIPKKEDGKACGYGFVVFDDLKTAAQAMQDLNAKKFHGNTVAADWCLPKNLFLRNQRTLNEAKALDEELKTRREDPPAVKKRKLESRNSDDDDEDEEDEENEEDEEGEDEDEDEEDEEEDEEDEEEDEEDDDVDDEEKPLKKKPKKVDESLEKKKTSGTQDVQEQRTVFIRNLSFDANKESLIEAFSKFGEVKSAFICYDKELERPRGTAFVQFVDKQSAIDACAESEMFELDSRKLQIDLALPRSNVNTIVEEKKAKTPKDNRNLALAKVGVIYANSYEANGLSKADLMRRQKLEAANAAKLKLLHHFVSPTRLSVHNIPINLSDQDLRDVFLKALNEEKNKSDAASSSATTTVKRRHGLLKCRIMRDLTRVNSEGVGRSKGYGFVEFYTHAEALRALHAVNNNPNLIKNGTRLIVQFSIEDMRALKKKETRLKKSVHNKKSVLTSSVTNQQQRNKTNKFSSTTTTTTKTKTKTKTTANSNKNNKKNKKRR